MIVKDRWTQNDIGNGRGRQKIIVKSGYGGKLTSFFSGNIIEAFTERKGTDLLTKIECQDGSYETANAISNFSLDKTATEEDALNNMINDLSPLEKGTIGDVFSTSSNARGYAESGNTWEILQNKYEGKAFKMGMVFPVSTSAPSSVKSTAPTSFGKYLPAKVK